MGLLMARDFHFSLVLRHRCLLGQSFVYQHCPCFTSLCLFFVVPCFFYPMEFYIRALHDKNSPVILTLWPNPSPPPPFNHRRQWCHFCLSNKISFLVGLFLEYQAHFCGRSSSKSVREIFFYIVSLIS